MLKSTNAFSPQPRPLKCSHLLKYCSPRHLDIVNQISLETRSEKQMPVGSGVLSCALGQQGARSPLFSFPGEVRQASSKRATGAGPFRARQQEGPDWKKNDLAVPSSLGGQPACGLGLGREDEGLEKEPGVSPDGGTCWLFGETHGSSSREAVLPHGLLAAAIRSVPNQRGPRDPPQPLWGGSSRWAGVVGRSCWHFPAAVPQP